jgi:hypothetical protein
MKKHYTMDRDVERLGHCETDDNQGFDQRPAVLVKVGRGRLRVKDA